MAERRRGKQKRQQDLAEKPTKVETAVAKHLRFNVPIKEGKLHGMPVQCFVANDAVNLLLKSKWASGQAKTDALFTNRGSCVDFCHNLLLKGMFHRAMKVERKKDKERGIEKKKKKSKEDVEESGKEEDKKSKKKSRKKDKEEEKKEEKKEESEVEKDEKKSVKEKEDKEEEKKEEEKKKKKKEKKIKLEMTDNQVFKDGEEIYVWIYDPVPFKTFVIGLFLVLGAIAVCLFPLWPPEVRLGVYYVSLTVASCIGSLLALCVVRVILFCAIWALTFGNHHFWLLPNLNEDVGFFESFQPLYFYEYMGDKPDESESKEDKDKSEEKSTKDEDEDSSKTEKKDTKSAEGSKEDSADEDKEGSGTGSELDNDNGYEIVDAEDMEENDPADSEEVENPEPKKTK